MKDILLTVGICIVMPLSVRAQDSLAAAQPTQTTRMDSAAEFSQPKLDSVQKRFTHQIDSLQKAYAKPLRNLHSSINKLNHKKDSLEKLHIPITSLEHKIDSLEKAGASKLAQLSADIQKEKQKTLAGISSLHLPPQAQGEVSKLTQDINGVSMPNNFFHLKGFVQPVIGLGSSLSFLNINPNLSIPSAKIPSLQKLNLNQLPSLSKLQGSLGTEINQLKTASNMQLLEKTVTNDLAQTGEGKSLLKQTSQTTALESKFSKLKNPKSASLAMQELKPAINHFAGKEEQLQAAMGKISKYKQKYSNLNGIKEAVRKWPNPLKSRPWQESFVPGINYFILSKPYGLFDVNPYVSWRFNPRLTVAIGWNERVGIQKGNFRTNLYDHVYGIRSAISYSWTHGFTFRLLPEVMKAYVPVGNTDAKAQALVWGLFTGLRKDFKIYKGLTGYSEALYNFFQKPGRNIYGDPLSFRLGLEMKLKKKEKKYKIGMVNPSSLKGSGVNQKDSINIVRKGKFYGTINHKGDTLVPFKYQRIKKFVSDGQLYFIVKKDKKFGALSSTGKEFIPVSHLEALSVRLEILDRVRRKYDLDKVVN